MSRFGTVPITMIRRRGETPTEWTPDYKSVTFHFPGGNVSETQTLGQGKMRLEVLVRLADTATFERFMALMNTEQTLRMDYHATAYSGDREGQEFRNLYKEFDNVFATSPTNIRRRLGGQVDLNVVFERSPKP